MNLVHNERVKLLATFLNTVAAAAVVVGLFTPFSGAIFRGESVTLSARGVVVILFWAAFALLLHGTAQRVLGGLRE